MLYKPCYRCHLHLALCKPTSQQKNTAPIGKNKVTIGDPYEKKAILIPILLALLMTPTLIALSTVNVTTHTNNMLNRASLKYTKRLIGSQRISIHIETTNKVQKTVVSLYAWLPNGSIKSLGVYSGKTTINIPRGTILSYLRTWKNYLIQHHTNPELVQPGIIALATIEDKNGVSTLIDTLPLSIHRLLDNKESLTISLVANNKTMISIINKAELQKEIQVAKQQAQSIKNKASVYAQGGKQTSPWPPSEIDEYCGESFNPGGQPYAPLYCYIWKLEENYLSKRDVALPVVVTRIYGGSADHVNTVNLRLYYESDEAKKIYVDFSAAAEVTSSSGSLGHEIAGFTVELGGNNKVWLDVDKVFMKGRDFQGPAILALGFYGDVALAKYKLYYCYQMPLIPKWECTPLDKEAIIALARPVIEDNRLVPWYGVDDNPFDGSGFLEKVFDKVALYWNWSTTRVSTGAVYFDYIGITKETDTIPLFALSIPVSAILAPETLPLDLALAASVGITKSDTSYMLASCYIDTAPPTEYSIWANYLYVPTKFLYNDHPYAMDSLYVDAWIP